jgi:hypothetical protein
MPETETTIPQTSRSPQDVTAVIKGRDSSVSSWTESVKLTSLSNNGAGFFLARPCEAGRLVSLMLPMPVHLRSYDFDKKLYRIWGLVQHCYRSSENGQSGYHVGVAFIGKDCPESYNCDPAQSYRIIGTNRRGLWTVEELDSPFTSRRHIRYLNPIKASLLIMIDDQRTGAKDEVETENVSEEGAAVFTNLRVRIGDRLKFRSKSPKFVSHAIVRNRRIGTDNRTLLHLEFIDDRFPVREIKSPVTRDGDK